MRNDSKIQFERLQHRRETHQVSSCHLLTTPHVHLTNIYQPFGNFNRWLQQLDESLKLFANRPQHLQGCIQIQSLLGAASNIQYSASALHPLRGNPNQKHFDATPTYGGIAQKLLERLDTLWSVNIWWQCSEETRERLNNLNINHHHRASIAPKKNMQMSCL